MSHHKHENWGWMLAFDIFFGGMGAAMLVVAGIAELLLKNGNVSVPSIILASAFIAVGAGLLTLELGRPFQAFRVFFNLKSILTFGAWNMSIAIVAGLLYGTSWIEIFPWFGLVGLRKILAIICIFTGTVVAAYPGILLGSHKSRPFWNGSGMVALFLTSSLLTGVSAYIVVGYFTAASANVYEIFSYVAAGLCAIQLVIWLGYIWIKLKGATEREARTAVSWTSGNYSGPFKAGFLGAGTLLPLMLFLMPNNLLVVIAGLMAIAGGLLMRNLVIYAGHDRTWLPGEERFRSRLPHGDEAFLKKVWTKQI